jgi:hypothetical protein
MKLLMTLLRDALLFTVLVMVMIFAVSGVVLPYRSVFAQAGAYQLQAFETGLAFSHYGLNGEPSFYRLSSLDGFEQKTYAVKWQETAKPLAILETLKQFARLVTPWYEVQSDGVKVRYETLLDGQDWLITKSVIFTTPTYVQKTGMSLTYFRNDLILDGATKEEISSGTLNSGIVQIINSNKPGDLTIIASDKQRISLNRSYNLIEIVEPVERKVSELTQTIRVRAHDGRQQ